MLRWLVAKHAFGNNSKQCILLVMLLEMIDDLYSDIVPCMYTVDDSLGTETAA